jgi:hypothetical protein
MKQTNFILWLVGYFYLCVYTNVTAQIVFNKTFQTDTTSMLSVAVAPLQDGYLVAGGFNSLNQNSTFFVRKTNLIGQNLWLKVLDSEFNNFYFTYAGNSMIEHNGDYLLIGSKGFDSANTDFLLVKFKNNGDTLWKKRYYTSNAEGNGMILKTLSTGYALLGWTQQYYEDQTFDPAKAYLIRIDEQGDTLWTSKFGTKGANILYAQQTQDGGFILSGYCYTAATGYDMYAVKTDSLGIVQWEKTYGTNQDDDGCFVLQLQTGNYILFGGIKNDNSDNIYIAELMSNSGNILWYKQYGVNEYCGVYPLHLTTDNQVVGVQYDYSNSQPTRYYLTKFSTTNGDIIWQSSQIHSNLGDTEDYLRDIEPTADGGFVLAGFNYGSPQSSWVVKTDSLGNTCSFINCDSTIYTGTNTATPALPTKASHIQVYPNPTNNNFTLSYQLPPNIAFGVLELYNTLGQKVLYKQAPQALTKISVSVAHLPASVYLYRFVTINGEVATGEIIVSR